MRWQRRVSRCVHCALRLAVLVLWLVRSACVALVRRVALCARACEARAVYEMLVALPLVSVVALRTCRVWSAWLARCGDCERQAAV